MKNQTNFVAVEKEMNVSLSNEILTTAYLKVLKTQQDTLNAQQETNEALEMLIQNIQDLRNDVTDLQARIETVEEKKDVEIHVIEAKHITKEYKTVEELELWVKSALVLISGKKKETITAARFATYKRFEIKTGKRKAEQEYRTKPYQSKVNAILSAPELRDIYIQIVLDMLFE